MSINDLERAAKAAVQVASVVYEIIEAEGERGCPSNILYLAMQEAGATMATFQGVLDALKSSGLVVERDFVLYARTRKDVS